MTSAGNEVDSEVSGSQDGLWITQSLKWALSGVAQNWGLSR